MDVEGSSRGLIIGKGKGKFQPVSCYEGTDRE